MKKDIYILGSGGFAKEVAFLIETINDVSDEWNLIGYVDKAELVGSSNGKYKVVATDEDIMNIKKEINIAIGIGNPSIIRKVAEDLMKYDFIFFPNIIHPNVIADWKRIRLGRGNIITAGNIFTTDIEIGSFNILNLNCTIGHDTEIGNFNVFNPAVNISGGVKVSDSNLVGTGAQILQYLEVKNNIIIGAGSVVTKNLIEEGVYVGIPARKLK